MKFAPRTTPLKEGEAPWVWGIDSVYQCTWWCFYRFFQIFKIYPCYQNAINKTGSYNNANTWIANVREPVEVKDPSYKPVAGDIAVYDYGEYGHVIFMETDTMTSEYRSGRADSFRNATFGDFKGNLLGFLHCPFDPVENVQRDTSRDQIECTDDTLRIRNKPSLEGQIVGHVQIGFYNVLSTSEADGYKWYEIAKDRWCANITTVYYPAEEEDFIKKLEDFLNTTRAKIKALESENENMRNDMKNIKNVAERWSK